MERITNSLNLLGSGNTKDNSKRSGKSYKLVMLGESGVGKSSIVLRFVKGMYSPESIQSTIGAAFITKNIQLDNETFRYEIWDTAGQEKFRSISRMYYRDAKAVVLVYDVCRRDTFDKLNYWVKQVIQCNGIDYVLMIVGNKTDIEDNRVVTKDEGQMFAKENNALYMETSSKLGTNTFEIFMEIANELKHPNNGFDSRYEGGSEYQHDYTLDDSFIVSNDNYLQDLSYCSC